MLTLNKSTCLAQMVSYSCFLCGFGSLACKEHSPPAASESRVLVRVYCRDLPVIPGQECCWNLALRRTRRWSRALPYLCTLHELCSLPLVSLLHWLHILFCLPVHFPFLSLCSSCFIEALGHPGLQPVTLPPPQGVCSVCASVLTGSSLSGLCCAPGRRFPTA